MVKLKCKNWNARISLRFNTMRTLNSSEVWKPTLPTSLSPSLPLFLCTNCVLPPLGVVYFALLWPIGWCGFHYQLNVSFISVISHTWIPSDCLSVSCFCPKCKKRTAQLGLQTLSLNQNSWVTVGFQLHKWRFMG